MALIPQAIGRLLPNQNGTQAKAHNSRGRKTPTQCHGDSSVARWIYRLAADEVEALSPGHLHTKCLQNIFAGAPGRQQGGLDVFALSLRFCCKGFPVADTRHDR